MLTGLSLSLFVTIVCLVCVQSASPEDDPNVTYVELFRHGVTAYQKEQWISCINYFARAVDDYKYYKKATSSCRRKCHSESGNQTIVTNLEDIENRFFETGIKHTLCLIKCRKATLQGRVTAYVPEVDEAMENLVPYDYLQLCYFKHGTPDRAATAAYTFLQANPGHETMQTNLKFYLSKEGKATQEDLKNTETKEYQESYKEGVAAYEKKNYQAVKDKMEHGLEAYLEEEENCRVMCEGSFDQDNMQPDLYIAVANHMTFALKSRLKCAPRLQKFDATVSSEGMVARFYLYLVRAYLELGQVQEACHAVESYLLFGPKDVSMLDARKKLEKNSEAKEKWFAPRPEALRYYQRERTEKNLLDFVEKEFAYLIEQNKEVKKPEQSKKDSKMGEMEKKPSKVQSA